MGAGTLAELLIRKGHALDREGARWIVRAFVVTVNGESVFEADRILQHGDRVRVGVDSYAA